jgi:short-subunit dehydrogenase
MDLMNLITADAERSAAMKMMDGLIASIQTLVNNAAINQEMKFWNIAMSLKNVN